MAPIKSRTTVYATPTHKRPPNLLAPSTTHKSAMKAKKEDANRETVGVFLRLRPLKLEDPAMVKLDDQQVKTTPIDGTREKVYSFTQVFDNAPQSEVFDKVARPVSEKFVRGDNGLIFTYGVTGSGKTYTMEGHKTDPGLIYRTIDFLFNSFGNQQTPRNLIIADGHNSYRFSDREQLYPNLARAETPSAIPSVIKWRNRTKETASTGVDENAYYCLFISLIELYKKQVFDLFEDFDLNALDKEKKRREIRTDVTGMSYVANAVEIEVKSADEAVEFYTRGVKRRKTGSTALNTESSRGHCVLNLKLVKVSKDRNDDLDEETLVSSQLCLVDLAGSERAKRTGATGGALHEASTINNSLSALCACIRALRDNEPTTNIRYRDNPLTRLFKSYFEGNGSVNMVLCVKPTAEDHRENNTAMEFGVLTQDVQIDYASPPKILKRSKSRAQDNPNYAMMYEFLERKPSHFEPSPDLNDEQFIESWIDRLKSNRDKRKKYVETALGAQNEVRQNILSTMNENASLRQQYETRAKDLRSREQQIDQLESRLGSYERSRDGKSDTIKSLERHIKDLEKDRADSKREIQRLQLTENKLQKKISARQANNERLWHEVMRLLKSEEDRSENRRKVHDLLKRLVTTDNWVNTEPSAPEMEPINSSSPVDEPNPSTSETTESHTTPTTTNSSSGQMEYHQHAPRTPVKTYLPSPTEAGRPVTNPRYTRSLSCPGGGKWLRHVPKNHIDPGTVLRAKCRNGIQVKNLKSSHLRRKDVSNYCLEDQKADQDGEVTTEIFKGSVIPTPCGGTQVRFTDIETMRQASPIRSPKRKRAASDAHYTH